MTVLVCCVDVSIIMLMLAWICCCCVDLDVLTVVLTLTSCYVFMTVLTVCVQWCSTQENAHACSKITLVIRSDPQ
jgi:hypothetical protein